MMSDEQDRYDLVAHLRQTIQPESRHLLNQIWQEHRQSARPLSRTKLHISNGGPKKVREILSVLGGSVVFETGGSGRDDCYCLTLLGALLTANGDRIEDALVAFLEHVLKRVQQDPDVRNFGPGQLSEDPAIAIDQLEYLERALRLRSTRLQLGGTYDTNNWSASVPNKLIDTLLEAQDIRGLVRSIAAEDYDAKLPIDGRRQFAQSVRPSESAAADSVDTSQDSGSTAGQADAPSTWEGLLHPVVRKHALPQFRDGHLRDAVFNACTVLFDHIRDRTGSTMWSPS